MLLKSVLIALVFPKIMLPSSFDLIAKLSLEIVFEKEQEQLFIFTFISNILFII